eukprot:COSAG02_NODE_422_length_22587_cov_10.209089_4_plen_61_part_00
MTWNGALTLRMATTYSNSRQACTTVVDVIIVLRLFVLCYTESRTLAAATTQTLRSLSHQR